MRILVWGLAGLVLGAGIMVLLAGLVVPSIWPVSEAEGANALRISTMIAPAGGALGAILGVLLGWWRS